MPVGDVYPKATGIAVKVDIYFLVFARLLTAVLMQQLVAVFGSIKPCERAVQDFPSALE